MPIGAATDAETLRDLGDPELAGELVALFVPDATARMDALEQAHAAGDRTAVHRLAHALVGSAASVGATHLAGAAGELEDRCRTAQPGDLTPLVAALRARLTVTVPALRAAVGALRRPGTDRTAVAA